MRSKPKELIIFSDDFNLHHEPMGSPFYNLLVLNYTCDRSVNNKSMEKNIDWA